MDVFGYELAPAEGLAVRLGWAADAAVPVQEDAT